MNKFYVDYGEYLGRFFADRKVQKISVNTGAGCPNRDGSIGTGGCIYCNNKSFTPAYCFERQGVADQIEAGKRFFARKYPEMRYLAYFQSFTNTYGKSDVELEGQFREALGADGVVGLIVGTRPDCLEDETVSLLARLNHEKPLFVELGVESMHDRTLAAINRGHDANASRDAINRLADAGLHVGVHVIAGLPGEVNTDVLTTVDEIMKLPVESIKLHHMQVLRDTTLEKMWKEGNTDIHIYDVEEYINLCIEIVKKTGRKIAIERFLASAPPEMVIAPKWGMKNHEFVNLLHNKLEKI